MKKIYNLIRCKEEKYPQLANDSRYRSRHRNYGIELNCTDIDMIEFDNNNKPVLITETKHWRSSIDLFDDQFIKLRNIADPLNLPLLCIVYYPPGEDLVSNKSNETGPDWYYYICPANKLAKNILERPKFYTEQEFIKLQYKLRNMELDEKELSKFSNTIFSNVHPNISGYLAL